MRGNRAFDYPDLRMKKGINEMVIDTLDEYITEIEIPVQLP